MLNHILSALPPEDRAELFPALEKVDLAARSEIERPQQKVDYVYFIEAGIAAILSLAQQTKVAIGLIGPEGASGVPVFLGKTQSPHLTVMLTSGRAFRVRSDVLRIVMDSQPEVTRLLLRYASSFFDQVANTCAANAISSVEQRVARWILMVSNRFDGERVPLTHEVIAFCLAVRRAGVTEALNLLRERALIHLERGSILIADRRGLENVAGPFAEVPKLEQRRTADNLASLAVSSVN